MTTFKCGDWVRYKGIARIEAITHTGYHLSNGYITKGDNGEMKLWIPKVGDWVIQDKCVFVNTFIVRRYDSVSMSPDSCKPFLGELPEKIKR